MKSQIVTDVTNKLTYSDLRKTENLGKLYQSNMGGVYLVIEGMDREVTILFLTSEDYPSIILEKATKGITFTLFDDTLNLTNN